MDLVKHYTVDAIEFDYHELNPFMEQEYRRRYEALFRLGRFAKGERLLEIGSGGGPGKALSQSRGLRHISLDISEVNLRSLRDASGWTTPVCAEAYHLPFADQSLPAILIAEVIEHIPDPVQALRECHRVLQNGGRLVVSVPWREIIPEHLCIHCNRKTPANAHLHSISEEKMTGWLQSAGFSRITTDSFLNKIVNRLGCNRLLRFLPHLLWRPFDRFCNFLLLRPATLMALAIK